jgi:hypothetical protein
MSEYREIQGAAVQSLASNTGTIEGQIWYDNVNGAFKLQGFNPTAAFSSGGNLGTARGLGASFGIQTSAVAAAGFSPPAPNTTATEEYNGSTWSGGNPVNTGRRSVVGAGDSETAGRIAGGLTTVPTNLHEEYDGTSWTTSTVLPAVRISHSAAGTSTASLIFAGTSPGAPVVNDGATLEWTGAAWTTGGTLNTARYNGAGFGGPTSAVMTTGQEPALSNKTEEYDGTSWTASNVYPASLEGVAAFGPQTNGVAAGGQSPYQTLAAVYDGTSWATTASLSAARQKTMKGGNGSTGFFAGGEGSFPVPGYTNTTEDFLNAGVETQTITTS